MSSTLVGVTSAAALLATLACIISISTIVSNINKLQDDIHGGMSEFRVSILYTVEFVGLL